jgi:hypothetical protein
MYLFAKGTNMEIVASLSNALRSTLTKAGGRHLVIERSKSLCQLPRDARRHGGKSPGRNHVADAAKMERVSANVHCARACTSTHSKEMRARGASQEEEWLRGKHLHCSTTKGQIPAVG